MNYSVRANLVNVFFIALIFLGPTVYCLYDNSLPTEIGRTVIVLSFLLGAFVIADWYHLYVSNSFGGAFGAVGLGLVLAAVVIGVAAAITGSSPVELATFGSIESWDNVRFLMRFYVAGVGVAAAAVVGVVRLIVITALGESVSNVDIRDTL